MLTSPHDFPAFVRNAGDELEDIAREKGENYVNNFDVKAFFDRELAKTGCFIATAVYGSSLSEEVLLFRRFRDDILLKSDLGSRAVEIYYRVLHRLLQPFPDLVYSKHSLDSFYYSRY